MSVLEESGEVTFRPISPNRSLTDSGKVSAPTEDIQANVSPVSENGNMSLVRVLQEQFTNEFAKMRQNIGVQLVSMREDIDVKLGDMQYDILKLKHESHDQVGWDQSRARGTYISNAPSLPTPWHVNRDNARETPNPSSYDHHGMGRANGRERGIIYDQEPRARDIPGISRIDPRSGFGDHQLPPIDRNSTPDHNENRNRFTPTREIRERAKPRIFDGNEDFDDYLSQFEIVAELNNWDYRTKSLQLAGHLAKDACGMLGELSSGQRRDYSTLVAALRRRFGAVERSEMFRAKLKTRVRGRNETISELAQAIKKLTRQAYPSAEPSLTNVLALDQFIDAMSDPEIRLRLREARPRDISEAETLAIRLETYRLADSQKLANSVNHINSSGSNDTQDSLTKLLVKLNENIENLSKTTSISKPNPSPSNRRENWENGNNRTNQRNNGWRSQGSNNKTSDHRKGNGNNRPWKNRNGDSVSQGPKKGYANSGDQQGNHPVSASGVGNRQTLGGDPLL